VCGRASGFASGEIAVGVGGGQLAFVRAWDRAIAGSLRQPIEIEAWVTRGTPELDELARALQAVLSELHAAGGGKLVYRITEANTVEARRAAKDAGLEELRLSESAPTKGYSGLAFRYGGEHDSIPVIDPGARMELLPFWVIGKIRELAARVDGKTLRFGVVSGKSEIRLDAPDLVARQSGHAGPTIKGVVEQAMPFYALVHVDLKGRDRGIDESRGGDRHPARTRLQRRAARAARRVLDAWGQGVGDLRRGGESRGIRPGDARAAEHARSGEAGGCVSSAATAKPDRRVTSASASRSPAGVGCSKSASAMPRARSASQSASAVAASSAPFASAMSRTAGAASCTAASRATSSSSEAAPIFTLMVEKPRAAMAVAAPRARSIDPVVTVRSVSSSVPAPPNSDHSGMPR
jgi:hypothetical protein